MGKNRKKQRAYEGKRDEATRDSDCEKGDTLRHTNQNVTQTIPGTEGAVGPLLHIRLDITEDKMAKMRRMRNKVRDPLHINLPRPYKMLWDRGYKDKDKKGGK